MKVKNKIEKNVNFVDLDAGDCFRWKGGLYIKTDWEQAVYLNDGMIITNTCGNMVTPVNAEVQIVD